MSRRTIQVFNMSFLDMMTNFLGAVIILLLLAMKHYQEAPCPQYARLERVYCDTLSNQIFGTVQPAFKQPLKAGDTLLVVVDDFARMPGANQQRCPLEHYARCTRRHCEQDPEPGLDPNAAACTILAAAQNIKCDDAGSSDPSDDTFTFDLLVQKAGPCGTAWRDSSGVIGQYGMPKRYGPFKINSGGKRIQVSDLTDKLAKARPVYVAAPTNCSTRSAGGSGGGNQHLNGNIFNLSWDDETDNVNLYVQKGNAWLYGGRKNEPSIGSWSDLRSGPLSKRTKSEIATIRRPGVYKIYGHFVSSRQKRNAVKVRLQVSSSAGSKFSQAFEFNLPAGQRSPKSGGVAPLKEIEVLPDGTIRILR